MIGLEELNRVLNLFAWWVYTIQSHNAVGLFDINTIAEGVSLKLLNEICGYNLENLNYDHNNYPGIDLGDKINKIGFQITTRKDARKIKECLEKFVKGQSKIYVNGIRFLIIRLGKKPQFKKEKYQKIYPSFDPDKHILTARDLLQEIRRIYDSQKETFYRIKGILEEEFAGEAFTGTMKLNKSFCSESGGAAPGPVDSIRTHDLLTTGGKKENQKYLQQLINFNKRLFFMGIPDLTVKQEVTLRSIFVMPRVVEGVPFKDYERLMQERGEDESFIGDESQRRRMMAARLESTEEKKEAVKFDSIFEESENRWFVVLGKPGSGKTTLLKYLMLETARTFLYPPPGDTQLLFPILVEIRKLEDALSKSNKPAYNILDYLYDSMRRDYLTLPPGFFEKHLESGRALVMFDGLDEVVLEARRTEIRQMIGTFITGHNPRNTVIITSRIGSYSWAQFSTTEYRHFILEDFNEDESEVFIRRWYRSQVTDTLEAETRYSDLKKALAKKPAIKELARNPFMLSIIALIHRYEAQLPQDRLLLYEKATNTLLYTRDNVRNIINEKFKPEDKQHFLEKVAFQLQTLEKGEETGTVIERCELYEILLADFCRLFNKENWQAKPLVEEFLGIIRLRTGLLVEHAPDRFGFVHKTFQEYFAAKCLADKNSDTHSPQAMMDYVEQFIENPFWQETLLLALRALPKRQALKVLEHVLNRDPNRIEKYFYFNRYFVMKFIAEQGKWLNNRDFIQKRLDDFFAFSWNEGKDRSYYSVKPLERFKNWVSTVTDSLVRSILFNKLLTFAQDTQQPGVLRRYCAEAIGSLGSKDKAVEILLAIAQNENQEGWLRCYCAIAVGNLGVKDMSVNILISITDDTQESRLRRECLYAVGNLGFKAKAVDMLLAIARDEQQDGWLRRECAAIAGNLGAKNKSLEILLAISEDEKQVGWMRRECAAVAGKLGKNDKATLDRLLAIAENENQPGDLRRNCAYAAGKSGVKDKAADILLSIIQDEKQSGYLRRACAESLGNLAVKDRAKDILLAIALNKKQDGFLRRACAEALGNLGLKEKAMNVLLAIAQDEKQSIYLRRDCAKTVGNLGVKDKALDILLDIAHDPTHEHVLKRQCAEFIGKLGYKEKAVEILVELYLALTDKYTDSARRIYNALWELIEI
jgi:HEAT repeat protein